MFSAIIKCFWTHSKSGKKLYIFWWCIRSYAAGDIAAYRVHKRITFRYIGSPSKLQKVINRAMPTPNRQDGGKDHNMNYQVLIICREITADQQYLEFYARFLGSNILNA